MSQKVVSIVRGLFGKVSDVSFAQQYYRLFLVGAFKTLLQGLIFYWLAVVNSLLVTL